MPPASPRDETRRNQAAAADPTASAWVRYSSGYHAAVTRRVAPSALSSLRLIVSTVSSASARRRPSALTEIDIASSAGIQPKCGIAGWALLSLKLADVFVEASFVGHMTT